MLPSARATPTQKPVKSQQHLRPNPGITTRCRPQTAQRRATPTQTTLRSAGSLSHSRHSFDSWFPRFRPLDAAPMLCDLCGVLQSDPGSVSAAPSAVCSLSFRGLTPPRSPVLLTMSSAQDDRAPRGSGQPGSFHFCNRNQNNTTP